MKPFSHLFVATVLTGSCLLVAFGQNATPPTFTGCVMPLERNPDFFTLCEPHTCSLLRGNVDPKWAGHTVKLRGVLHPATSTQPRTLDVKEAVTIGEPCQAVCRPTIPGRGLGPKDKPSGEGATPGIVAPNPPK